MFKTQTIDTYNVFLFSKFTFPQSRQHIIDSKLKLKLSRFVLFKNAYMKALETFFDILLNIE